MSGNKTGRCVHVLCGLLRSVPRVRGALFSILAKVVANCSHPRGYRTVRLQLMATVRCSVQHRTPRFRSEWRNGALRYCGQRAAGSGQRFDTPAAWLASHQADPGSSLSRRQHTGGGTQRISAARRGLLVVAASAVLLGIGAFRSSLLSKNETLSGQLGGASQPPKLQSWRADRCLWSGKGQTNYIYQKAISPVELKPVPLASCFRSLY